MKPPQLLVLLLASAACVGLQTVFGSDLKLTETDDVIRVTLRDKPVLHLPSARAKSASMCFMKSGPSPFS